MTDGRERQSGVRKIGKSESGRFSCSKGPAQGGPGPRKGFGWEGGQDTTLQLEVYGCGGKGGVSVGPGTEHQATETEQ